MTREEFLTQLPGLVESYKPSDDVLKKIGSISLLMIIGPTGSGKTTLMKRSGIPHVLTDTTRPPRPGEVDGVDFYFRSDYDVIVDNIHRGRFAQLAVGATGDLYGTRGSSYPESGIVTMAVMADVVPIFRQLGFASTISAFITPPSNAEWQRRIGNRPLPQGELSKRLEEAERSFRFALSDAEVHLLLNDNIEDAHHQLIGLIDGQVDEDREQLAIACAKELLAKLESSKDEL